MPPRGALRVRVSETDDGVDGDEEAVEADAFLG
jgi:hypothetical protein